MKTKITLLIIMLSVSMLFAQEKHIVIENEQGAFKSRKIEDNVKITYYTTAFASCGDKILYEGKVYGTILIGSQCWFKENLNVGVFQIGTNNQTDNGGTNIIEKYCYNNDPANCDLYGGLYQWNEAMKYSTVEGSQGICPTGWHIPTRVEMNTFKTAVSSSGNSIKAIGQGTGDGAGTNTNGFTGLLAGYRIYSSGFSNLETTSYFWSSNQTSGAAYFLKLDNTDNILVHSLNKSYGFSVRCLKN